MVMRKTNFALNNKYSLNEGVETTTTTVDMSVPVNGIETVIARHPIQCYRGFTVSSEADLTDGVTKSSNINSDLAIMKLLDLS